MMALEITNTPYKMVGVDPRKGETKTAEFKKVIVIVKCIKYNKMPA